MTPYAMISYARKSRDVHPDFFRDFRDSLETFLEAELTRHPNGGSWVRIDDQHVEVGDVLVDAVRSLVDDASAMVVLHDRLWRQSRWCPAEVNQWVGSTGRGGLVPVTLEKPHPLPTHPPEGAGAPPELVEAHGHIAGRLQVPLFHQQHDVPLDKRHGVDFSGPVKRIAAAIAPHLRGQPRVAGSPSPDGAPSTPRLLLCPSSGSAEDARADVFREFCEGPSPYRPVTVEPAAGDLTATLALLLQEIQASEVSVHFFGSAPAWLEKGQYLGLLALDAALERARTGDHRVCVWMALECPLRDEVVRRADGAGLPPGAVRVAMGTRSENLRRLREFLAPPPRTGSGSRALVVDPAGTVPAVVQGHFAARGVHAEAVRLTGGGWVPAVRQLLDAPGAVADLVFVVRGAALPPSALLACRRALDAMPYSSRRWMHGSGVGLDASLLKAQGFEVLA